MGKRVAYHLVLCYWLNYAKIKKHCGRFLSVYNNLQGGQKLVS